MSPRISWEGVFPAVTTQFNDDLSLNIDATAKVMDGLIRDGVSGLIVCGSVGENTSLERKEKIAIMETAKSVAAGRVPVLCGIAEFTTAFAVETAKLATGVRPDEADDLGGVLDDGADSCELVLFMLMVSGSCEGRHA